jgi:hypothetical protein
MSFVRSTPAPRFDCSFGHGEQVSRLNESPFQFYRYRLISYCRHHMWVSIRTLPTGTTCVIFLTHGFHIFTHLLNHSHSNCSKLLLWKNPIW